VYRERVNYYSNQSRFRKISFYKNGFFIFCGANLVAISLQLFLVKNYVIDGGIVGVSIMLSHIMNLEVGMLLLILNIPFLILGYFYLGGKFVLFSLYASSILAIGTYILEPFDELTNNPFLVIILGGLTLGMGIGVIIRFGGCLDGTEVLAILLSKRSPFSIGQYLLLFNFFIFGSSIFLFGITEAVYSLATFFISYKTIDSIILKS
jgi:uncharacterized membrane-anchored protein YitT (DUF2179 family)